MSHNMLLVIRGWLQIPRWISQAEVQPLCRYCADMLDLQQHTVGVIPQLAGRIPLRPECRLLTLLCVKWPSLFLPIRQASHTFKAAGGRSGARGGGHADLHALASPWWWFNLSDYPECTQFRCANGACYNQTQRCDHIPDCRDGSDEANCSKKPVLLQSDRLQVSFNCPFTLKIVSLCGFLFWLFLCPPLAQHCNDGLFACRNGLCVPQRYVCDHDDDCGDRSDEINCSTWSFQSSPCLKFTYSPRVLATPSVSLSL